MNRVKELRNGSSVIDYALLLCLVVVTLVIMGGYIQRSIHGKWKDMTDVYGRGRQYPGTVIIPRPGGSGGSGGEIRW